MNLPDWPLSSQDNLHLLGRNPDKEMKAHTGRSSSGQGKFMDNRELEEMEQGGGARSVSAAVCHTFQQRKVNKIPTKTLSSYYLPDFIFCVLIYFRRRKRHIGAIDLRAAWARCRCAWTPRRTRPLPPPPPIPRPRRRRPRKSASPTCGSRRPRTR